MSKLELNFYAHGQNKNISNQTRTNKKMSIEFNNTETGAIFFLFPEK